MGTNLTNIYMVLHHSNIFFWEVISIAMIKYILDMMQNARV